MLRRLIVSLSFCLLLPAALVKADNVIITGGGATFIPTNLFGATAAFNAQGNDFSGFVNTHPTEIDNPGCGVSTANFGCVSVKTGFGFATQNGFGGFTYQGISHPFRVFPPNVFLQLFASAPAVPIPEEFWTANQIEVISPVQLTGIFGDTDLFGTLTGQGYGVFTFAQRPAPFGTSLQFLRADYFFLLPDAQLPPASVRAIPEPASLLLFSMGLALSLKVLRRSS